MLFISVQKITGYTDVIYYNKLIQDMIHLLNSVVR